MCCICKFSFFLSYVITAATKWDSQDWIIKDIIVVITNYEIEISTSYEHFNYNKSLWCLQQSTVWAENDFVRVKVEDAYFVQ